MRVAPFGTHPAVPRAEATARRTSSPWSRQLSPLGEGRHHGDGLAPDGLERALGEEAAQLAGCLTRLPDEGGEAGRDDPAHRLRLAGDGLGMERDGHRTHPVQIATS